MMMKPLYHAGIDAHSSSLTATLCEIKFSTAVWTTSTDVFENGKSSLGGYQRRNLVLKEYDKTRRKSYA